MDRRSPALIERIVAGLRRRPGPRSSADIAQEFLGTGLLDEAVADRLLGPALAADLRLCRVANGWALVDALPERSSAVGATPLAAPFVAVCSPAGTGVAAAHAVTADRPGEEPQYAVALGGTSEVRRGALLTGRSLPGRAVSLLDVARRRYGYSGPPDPVRVAEALALPHLEEEASAGAFARLVAMLWERWRSELSLEDVDTLETLDAMLEAKLEAADFSDKGFGPGEISVLPEGPGVYAFEDAAGGTLYVGQSSSLRVRVASYFSGPPRDEKDRALRREAVHLRTEWTDTPPDALILESRWIRRLAPRLNRRRQVGSGARANLPDGVLVVPASERKGAPIAVLFALAGGALRARVPLRHGARRAAKAALRAAEAVYFRWPDEDATQGADAALVTTWHRIRPDLPHLAAERFGDAERLARALLDTLDVRGNAS